MPSISSVGQEARETTQSVGVQRPPSVMLGVIFTGKV
jgi:hypothetical protein